jgi:RES domain-containing protein
MFVFRITGRKHASDIQGTGAALHPGRWNKKGTPVLYTSESRELALLEIIVHTPPMMIPDLDILTIEIPDDSITELKVADLPDNWNHYPAPGILAEIAEKWITEGKTISLKVPSCIFHESNNYILNCRHENFHLVKIIDHKKFHFDPRLTS